jgi:hypothetical protein
LKKSLVLKIWNGAAEVPSPGVAGSHRPRLGVGVGVGEAVGVGVEVLEPPVDAGALTELAEEAEERDFRSLLQPVKPTQTESNTAHEHLFITTPDE